MEKIAITMTPSCFDESHVYAVFSQFVSDYQKEGPIEIKYIKLHLPVNKKLTSSERKLAKRQSHSMVLTPQTRRRDNRDNHEIHKEILDYLVEKYNCHITMKSNSIVLLVSKNEDKPMVIMASLTDKAIRFEMLYNQNCYGEIRATDLTLNGRYLTQPDGQIEGEDSNNTVNIRIATFPEEGEVTTSSLKLYTESFDSIAGNYVKEVSDKTYSIMNALNNDDHLGKIVILSGDPGTGKSYWIKCFAKSLEKNYKPVLIPQAMRFFDSVNNYYALIDALEEKDGYRDVPYDEEDEGIGSRENLLLIFEDTGQLFQKDARHETPQIVSTMLNITDGLIGSGRDDIFVFSFNEEITKLDSAIIRPGRCIGQMTFKTFKREEAVDWLVDKGMNREDVSQNLSINQPSYSLADLYNYLLEFQQIKVEKEQKTALGFV